MGGGPLKNGGMPGMGPPCCILGINPAIINGLTPGINGIRLFIASLWNGMLPIPG